MHDVCLMKQDSEIDDVSVYISIQDMHVTVVIRIIFIGR
jgi:hypothetical protein